MRKKAQALRWAWAGLGIILSPLYFMQAPRIPLFKLQLGLTEFGHWLALPSLALALLPPFGARRARAACALAALLYLGPALRAFTLAPTVRRDASAAWPLAPAGLGPAFSWRRLFQADPQGPALIREDAVYDTARQLDLTCWRRADGEGQGLLRPYILVIHGGGWDGGQRGDFPAWDRALAEKNYGVVDIDYRLAPASPWPAQREDILKAMMVVRQNAPRWGFDAGRCVLMGRSAGAQLALATAYSHSDPAIKGVVSFYGPADLFFAYQYGSPDDILSSLDLLKNFCAGTPSSNPTAYQSASPYFHVDAQTPPTLLAHGRIDALVWQRQSSRLALKLAQAGRPCQFMDLPWATHAFDYNFRGPSGQLAWYSLQRFLATVLP
jgi:acetyl esterase/lipase